jgi:DNA-binding GntR family transcriptional regulator
VPTVEEARSLLESRFLVERAVVERAVRLRDAGDLSDLGALVSRLSRSRTMAEFTELTVRFHLRLALAARNPILTSFLREVLNKMALFGIERTRVSTSEKAALLRGCELYERFYAALVHSDPAAADRCVDDHKAYVQDLYQIDFVERPA